MSYHELEKKRGVSVSSEEVARQNGAVTDPFLQQFAHFCNLMQELKDEQVISCHEKTASSIIAFSSSGSGGRLTASMGELKQAFLEKVKFECEHKSLLINF